MLNFNKEDFFKAIEQLAKQNLLEENEILEIIETSVIKSFHSKFDPDAELSFTINPEKKILKLVNNSKTVVDEEVPNEYRSIEISLEDAKEIDKKAEVGDTISEEVDFSQYSKSIANQIKQLITQSIREKRKKAIYAKHKSLKGEMVKAKVTSSSRNHAILELEDGTVAFMPSKFKNPKIKLAIGENVQVYIEDVLEESKEAQIIVSNGSKLIVKRLLEVEVPEISDGIVEIMSISRMPGIRTKVAVRTNDQNVDPVGAIIGSGGTRISEIIKKLDGEKLDIIEWSSDINKYIANSLSPAKVISVIDKKDENGEVINGHKIAITPNQHQTLAIGKRGSNARLAVELAQHRIDVISYDEALEKGIEIEWNGNVSPEDLVLIEEGKRPQRNISPSPSTQKSSRINISNLDSDIESFNEELSSSMTEENKINMDDESFEINMDDIETEDDMFSDDELQEMQEEFDFDEDLADIDPDFLDA